MLSKISSNKQKVLALHAQLNFRKFVLKQDITFAQNTNKANKSKVYHVTKVVEGKRKNLSWQELACNVKTLITQAFTISESNPISEYDENRSNDGSHLIMGKRVNHRFTIDQNVCSFQGQVLSQVSAVLIFM